MLIRSAWRLAAILLMAFVIQPVFGQVLVNEDFAGSGLVDQSVWRLPFGGDGAYFGRTLVKTDLATEYPSISNGVATLELDTFLDDGTGDSAEIFHGAGLHTKRNFAVGGGLRFNARARLVDPVPGLDGGLFLFDVQRTNASGESLRDEIDLALLSNDSGSVFTNFWNEGSFSGPDAGGTPEYIGIPEPFDLTQFHDYRVDWQPNRIDWYVDDQRIRTQTVNIPDDPMNFRMNLWAPDADFSEAYSASLQPATSAATNQTYGMEIDRVQIERFNTNVSENLILDPSFEDPTVPFYNLSFGDTPDESATGQWVAFNNVNFSGEVANSGITSMAMFGPFSGGPDASGIFQNVDASPGEVFEASVFTQSISADSIRGQANYTTIKVEFLDANGDVLPGLDQFLGANSKESVILEGRDPDMPEDMWVERQVDAVAPEGTTKARVSLLFIQLDDGGGAAWFDDLSLVRLTASGISGDFNGDGAYDCQDVDALVADIATMSNSESFDLTGDGLVDTEDLNAWLAEAGDENLASGASYILGDANLDGSVDVSDFNAWNSNKFTATGAWCSGDFNADGFVDVSDFNAWNSNKFTSADGTSVVPEPGNILWMALLMIHFAVRRRRTPLA